MDTERLRIPKIKSFEHLDEQLWTKPFIDQFFFNINMLNYRLSKVSMINTMDKKNQMEFLMVFDSALCIIRGILLENPNRKSNYTVQNYLRVINREENADKLDNYLDTSFDFTGITIRDALKFIADKFVCHIDDINLKDIGKANAIMAGLGNPYYKNNLKTILSNINTIINHEEAD